MRRARALDNLHKDILANLTAENGVSNPYKRANFDPASWGPPGWAFIDAIVEGYPESAGHYEIQMMHSFIMSLGVLLPCQKCRLRHGQFVRSNPPDQYLRGKQHLRRWFTKYKQK